MKILGFNNNSYSKVQQSFYTNKVVSILLVIVLLSFFLESIFFDKISVAFLLYFIIKLGSKESKLINPFYLFSVTPFSLLIYVNVANNSYMLDLTHETYFLALINMFAFVYGLSRSLKDKINYKINYITSRFTKRYMRTSCIILFLISFIGVFVPFLDSIFWLFSIPAILFAIKTKEKFFFIVALFFIYLKASILLSKTAVLLYCLTFLVSLEKLFDLSKKQQRFIKLFTGFCLFFMVFAFSFANKERGAYDANEGVEYYSQNGVKWDLLPEFFMPYMYITTPWTNLQYATVSQDTRTYGLWLLKPIINYFQLDDNFVKEYRLTPFSSFNTFTFVTVFFKDFGYWLSILPAFFLGLLVNRVYSNYLLSSSPYDIATYVIFSLATVEMFFSNHFLMHSYPFTMIIVMGLTKFYLYNKNLYNDN